MSDRERDFERLSESLPTDAHRRRLEQVIRGMGLRRDDAVFSIFVALDHYLRLYEEIPDKIRETAKEVVEDFRQHIEAVVKNDVSGMVGDIASSTITATEKRERPAWIAALAWLGVVSVTCVAVVACNAYDRGYVAGAGASREAVDWALSDPGVYARALDRSNLLTGMSEDMLSWVNGDEGSLYYKLGRSGILEGITSEDIRWFAGEAAGRARRLDEAGLLDGETLTEMKWIRTRAGQLARELSTDGTIHWVASEVGQRARGVCDEGTIRVLETEVGRRLMDGARRNVGDKYVDMMDCRGQDAEGRAWRVDKSARWCVAMGRSWWPYVPKR